MSEAQSLDGRMSERRIRFVDAPIGGDVVLMNFKDPAPCYAVLTEGAPKTGDTAGDSLDVVLMPLQETAQGLAGWMPEAGDPDAAPPVYVKYRGVELLWRPGRAVLQCDAGQAESLVAAVVEFAHYERELRRVEDEIAEAWGELDEDRGLAFDVSSADLRRSEIVGRRMDRTLRRRMRLARIEPHLYLPDRGCRRRHRSSARSCASAHRPRRARRPSTGRSRSLSTSTRWPHSGWASIARRGRDTSWSG